MTRYRFHYSRVYEGAVAALRGRTLARSDVETGLRKARAAQALWERQEPQVLAALAAMFRTDDAPPAGTLWLSLELPHSFSDPPTISIRNQPAIEDDRNAQQALIAKTAHELAHVFFYSGPPESFARRLYQRIETVNLVGSAGGNLHYLIQAVEFAVLAEQFGESVAASWRSFKAEHSPDADAGRSAQLLIDHAVPLDRGCLSSIERRVAWDR